MRQRTGQYLTLKSMGVGHPSWAKISLLLAVGTTILSSLCTASPTNPIQPVFIQRDLPPAPYAYGMQDFDSSEEVTIVKRAGQTVYTPTSTTHLTTPQALPTPLAQVQTATPAQPLQVPLSLQQLQKPPKKTIPTVIAAAAAAATATANAASDTVPAAAATAANGSTNEAQQQVSKGSPEQTSLMEVELETAPRPEDLPQPAELTNAIPQKRNVYSKYAAQVQPNGCGCGGYVLVEKKIYVCEPKETIVRLMKRSHDDVCAAQETQHVGVTADNPEQMFQLIPMQDGMMGPQQH